MKICYMKKEINLEETLYLILKNKAIYVNISYTHDKKEIH